MENEDNNTNTDDDKLCKNFTSNTLLNITYKIMTRIIKDGLTINAEKIMKKT